VWVGGCGIGGGVDSRNLKKQKQEKKKIFFF
jgi:hypothetical protein